MSGPFGSSQWMYSSGASGFYDFPIESSLKLNYLSEGFLTMTPSSSPTSSQKFTMSYWIKRTLIAAGSNTRTYFLYAPRNGGDGSNEAHCSIDDQGGNRGNVRIYDSGGNRGNLVSVANLRDNSSWINIVFAVDLTQATDTNRVKLYFNGVQSSWTGTYPAQNTSWGWNNTSQHTFGAYRNGDGSFGDYYVADFNMIDGQQLAPSSFGEFKNDIWVPKDTAGLTFGTNGVRLEFKQSGTSANSSGIGADTSGNGHHFAVTALDANDCPMRDTPTSNLMTLDSLYSNAGGPVLSQGNLKYACSTNNRGIISNREIPNNGKWYYEYRTINENDQHVIGLNVPDFDNDASRGGAATAIGISSHNGNSYNGSNYGSGGASYASAWASGGDVVGVAIDRVNNTIKFRIDNQNSNAFYGTLAINANARYYAFLGTGGSSSDNSGVFNFGQNSNFLGQETRANNSDANGHGDFLFAVPSGYLALASQNLSVNEKVDPNEGASPQDYFQTKLYTGNGQSSLDIDLDFTPDWVWIKRRAATQSYVVANKLSGDDKNFSSNGASAEETDNTKFRNFLTNSFRVGSHNGVNNNGSTYVSWNWRLNGSGGSNTNGTINTTATTVAAHNGLSLSTFTGNGEDNATIGHGLGQKPEIVLIKPRSINDNWVVSWGTIQGDQSASEGNKFNSFTDKAYFYLNSNNAADGASNNRFLQNDSDTVNLGTNWSNVNQNNATYLMWAMVSTPGFSDFGSYKGNGSSDGTHVYVGFRPAWILIRKLSGADTLLWDTKRNTQNVSQTVLYPAEDIAEGTESSRAIDILSNGFKIRTDNANSNTSGTLYFYMAFAEQPGTFSNAR